MADESGDDPAPLAPVVGGRRRVFSCHRANFAPGLRPNSLEAVRACVAAGAPRVEIDVHPIRPGLAVVAHGPTLPDGRSLVEACTGLDRTGVANLRDEHGDPMLALLDDVVSVLAQGPTHLHVDLKARAPLGHATESGLRQMLRPLDGRAVVSSDQREVARRLQAAGFEVGFDPFRYLHWWPSRPGNGFRPRTLGVHGFWDDAPVAARADLDAATYLHGRLHDLASLVPGAHELFIEHRTLLAMADRGIRAGEFLRGRGMELAAWTVPDEGEAATRPVLERLFDLGATTIITDSPRQLARYVTALSRE